MALGDVQVFDQFLVDREKGLHNVGADTFKLALITSAVTPSKTTPDPRWGSGGSTNLSSSQVTPGGNYASGGPTLASMAVSLTGDLAMVDADDITIAQSGSNPTNARWGIIYNDSDSGKRAVGYVDLGSAFDMTGGPLVFQWNANGLWRSDQT